MDGKEKRDNVLGVWIDLIDTKDKMEKLSEEEFRKYLHGFNGAVIDSIYESYYETKPGHLITYYNLPEDLRILIFADTVYLEILGYDYISGIIFNWLTNLYKKSKNTYALSIYISTGEAVPYSEEMQKLPEKLKKRANELHRSYNLPPTPTSYFPTYKFNEPKVFTMFGLSESLEKIWGAESFGKKYNLGEGLFIEKEVWDIFVKRVEELQNKPVAILFYHNGKRVEFVKTNFSEIQDI